MVEKNQKQKYNLGSYLINTLHSIKKLFIIVLIVMGYLLIISLTLNIVLCISSDKRIAKTICDMTYIKEGFRLSDSHSINERKEKFRAFMIRIIDTYGLTYRANMKPPTGLSPKDKRDYILECWELARLIDINEYNTPTLHKKETCFNPWAWNQDSGLDEKGIGQQTWDTALTAMAIVKYIMPDRLKKRMDITITKPEDLYEWKNSTRITFILIWYYLRKYNFREEWAISCYKWNNFLGRRWDNGKGDIPAKFTISGIEYSPIAYYADFKSWCESWNNGDIEPGKVNAEYWASFEKKMMKEEIKLRKVRSIIKGLRKDIKQLKIAKDDYKSKFENAENKLEEAESKLGKVYKLAGREKFGEGIRKHLKKGKGITDKLLKEVWGKEVKISKWVYIGLLSVFSIGLMLLGVILFLLIKLLIKRRERNK